MGHIKQKKSISDRLKSIEEKYNPDDHPPKFSLQFLVNHSDFCYDSLDKEQKVALINALNKLSHVTWAELRTTQRHGLGYEIIEKHVLRFQLPAELSVDSHIIAFRFYSKAPMLGFRSEDGTFYIIAFDCKFKAYKHS